MNASGHLRWVRAALLVGVVYFVAGHFFAALAGSAASNEMRVAWRLAAWAISAAAFALHIRHEHVRLRSSAGMTALHVSLAVGLGAFLLAVAASLHARSSSTHAHFPAIALVVWPVMTGLPAFVVALAAAAVLGRVRHGG